MSRGNSRRADANGEALPFWDEPDGRRRRGKKKEQKHHRSSDEGRSRRPRYEDQDWDDEYDADAYDSSEWGAVDLDDDLDLADGLDDDTEWDDDDWNRGSEDSYDDGDDWRSRDDR